MNTHPKRHDRVELARARLHEGSRLALLTGLALAFTALAAAPAPAWQPARQEASRPPTQRALLVGCTEYPALREAFPERYESELRLAGPANDVALMRRALEGTFGFAPTDIVELVGWGDEAAERPTKANIVRQLARLADDTVAGDWVVVYLAGHGSQSRSDTADLADEPDGLDEVFLPADVGPASGSGRIPRSLSDDELGRHVRRIRDAGAGVWLVLDCCHAGTMVRGERATGDGLRLRGIDPGLLGVQRGTVLRGGFHEPHDLGPGDLDGIAAMYGAQSFGRAPEMRLPRGADDARAYGLFTYLLAQELTAPAPA